MIEHTFIIWVWWENDVSIKAWTTELTFFTKLLKILSLKSEVTLAFNIKFLHFLKLIIISKPPEHIFALWRPLKVSHTKTHPESQLFPSDVVATRAWIGICSSLCLNHLDPVRNQIPLCPGNDGTGKPSLTGLWAIGMQRNTGSSEKEAAWLQPLF